MISEEVNSLPSKSRSLRAKSIAKRLATEKNQIEANNNTKPAKRSSNSSKHHTMSKYRRKVANAKERERMKLVSEAFDRLSNVVPVYKMMTSANVQSNEQLPPVNPDPNVQDNKNPVTKVSTLRCAIAYINSLQRLIEDSNRGILDPALYALDEDEDDENENKFVENKSNKKAKKDGNKSKKGNKKSDKSKRHNNNSNNKISKKNKNFKVRQYHASDFRKSKKSTGNPVVVPRPMSKAQLNLAIAKGLQNCKPIYTPPPPAKKLVGVANPNSTQQPPTLHFPTQPLQLIQLRPLNMTGGGGGSHAHDSSTDSIETASLQSENDYLMPSLEVFLQQPSPTSSSTSSITASSPVSSSGGSNSECFTTILEEPHILDDIQAVLMDADNFDILV